ncbi:hypothetical protein PMAYCL1PPCAC_28816, partial [Pristionchus mayeri]
DALDSRKHQLDVYPYFFSERCQWEDGFFSSKSATPFESSFRWNGRETPSKEPRPRGFQVATRKGSELPCLPTAFTSLLCLSLLLFHKSSEVTSPFTSLCPILPLSSTKSSVLI